MKDTYATKILILKVVGNARKWISQSWQEERSFIFVSSRRTENQRHSFSAAALFSVAFELYQPDISASIEVWKPIFIDYFLHQLTHYSVDLNYLKVAVDITCKEFS